MDKAEVATYQKMTQALRNAGIRAEMYLGSSGMKAQMKYADKRNAPCVIIQGSDERAKGEVTIKDLIEGAKAAAAIKDNKEWKEARPAQFSVSGGEPHRRSQKTHRAASGLEHGRGDDAGFRGAGSAGADADVGLH